MKRIARIARFIFTAAILATVTILFLRGRDPTFLSFRRPSPAEKALGRVIARVEFRHKPFYEAVDELCGSAGLQVVCGEGVNVDGAYYTNVNLVAEQITLDQALRRLMTSAAFSKITFIPERSAIRLVHADSPAQPFYFDSYPIPDDAGGGGVVFLRPSPLNWTSPPVSVAWTMDWLAPQCGRPMALFTIGSGRNSSCVLQSASGHRQYRQGLAALRADTPGGGRRVLPIGTEIFDYADGEFRSRDASPAEEKLRTSFAFAGISPQPLTSALKELARQAGIEIFPSNHSYFDEADVSLPPQRITLASALEELLTQNGDDPKAIVPDDRAIWCDKDSLLRIYDLDRFLSRWPPADRQLHAAALLAALPFDHGRPPNTSSSETAGYLESMLVIDAPWRDQEAIAARLTQAMHDEIAPKRPAATP